MFLPTVIGTNKSIDPSHIKIYIVRHIYSLDVERLGHNWVFNGSQLSLESGWRPVKANAPDFKQVTFGVDTQNGGLARIQSLQSNEYETAEGGAVCPSIGSCPTVSSISRILPATDAGGCGQPLARWHG